MFINIGNTKYFKFKAYICQQLDWSVLITLRHGTSNKDGLSIQADIIFKDVIIVGILGENKKLKILFTN